MVICALRAWLQQCDLCLHKRLRPGTNAAVSTAFGAPRRLPQSNSGFTEGLGGRRSRPAGVLSGPGTAPGRQRATQATRDLLGNNRLPGSLSSAKLAQPRETGCWLGGRSVSNRRRPRPHQRRRLGSHPAACRPSSGLRQGSFVQLTNGSPAALEETRRSAGLARARNRSPSLDHQAQPRGRRGSRNARWKMCPFYTSTSTGRRS